MNNIKELYELWLEKAKDVKEVYDELIAVEGKDDEILDRFYRNLEFGTGGLRGVIGAGTNRMNVFTVNQATQGLADYLNEVFENPSIAIAHDSRINSDVFAKSAAEVLAGNGIKVYFYPELVPTPMLSFAVRKLRCSSGIVLTASHNPSQYNGYKCYDEKGYQMTDEGAAKTYAYMQKVDMFTGVKLLDFDKGLENGMIEYIGQDVYDEFYKAVLAECINPEITKQSDLKIIYTPLNGTGNKPVRHVLKEMGFKDVTVVPAQENPDGHFPTCPYPNPEIRQAFEEAIKLANEIGGDLLLATDPDCDRVGIAVNDGGEYKLMTGNEVGVLLAQYLLSCKKANGTLPENPAIIKTIVTTNLISAVAEKYNCEIYDLLTGFKYIGELITELEAKGEVDRYILGMEESYGYLTGIHARDKDAVNGASLICEMAAYYKATCGKNLYQVMQDIYDEYGMYMNTLLNFAFAGAEGMDKMKAIMTELRENPPKEIAGMKVTKVSDYLNSVAVDTETGEKSVLTLPKSNVLAYALPGGNGAIIRPSGTEPKIKIYVTAVGKDRADAQALTDKISADMKGFVGVE